MTVSQRNCSRTENEGIEKVNLSGPCRTPSSRDQHKGHCSRRLQGNGVRSSAVGTEPKPVVVELRIPFSGPCAVVALDRKQSDLNAMSLERRRDTSNFEHPSKVLPNRQMNLLSTEASRVVVPTCCNAAYLRLQLPCACRLSSPLGIRAYLLPLHEHNADPNAI